MIQSMRRALPSPKNEEKQGDARGALLIKRKGIRD
jgi:hypothetical protein